jgi:hypothetical protein
MTRLHTATIDLAQERTIATRCAPSTPHLPAYAMTRLHIATCAALFCTHYFYFVFSHVCLSAMW